MAGKNTPVISLKTYLDCNSMPLVLEEKQFTADKNT